MGDNKEMDKVIVVATNNQGKAREFREMFAPKGIRIKTLADFEGLTKIVENGETFTENALIKATAVALQTQLPVIADDSGLQVVALNGEPGIHSARYAGDHDDQANNEKLLQNLKDVPLGERTAVFHTSLVLFKPTGEQLITEGEVTGQILMEPRGENGFGYDPLFYVTELGQTMAEMSDAQKNKVSHRGRALKKMMTQFDDWW